MELVRKCIFCHNGDVRGVVCDCCFDLMLKNESITVVLQDGKDVTMVFWICDYCNKITYVKAHFNVFWCKECMEERRVNKSK